jgi:energy-coupling factor transporter ATP-binding protein EcfA2
MAKDAKERKEATKATEEPLKPLYPDGMLAMPREDRFEFYKHEQFLHREFERVVAEIRDAIRNPGTKYLVAVIGPTGVGKSEAMRLIQRIMEDVYRDELIKAPGHLASIAYYVPAYQSKFDWKDESESFMLAGHEPSVFIDRKVDFDSDIIRRNGDGEPMIFRDMVERKLMRARQRCLMNRAPKVVLADEAHNYKKVGVGRNQMLNQADKLKQILDLSRIVHVFFGTYELVDLLDASEQIARRTRYIHFPRYQLSDKKHLRGFKEALRIAQQLLPLAGVLEESDWVKEYKYFYYGSLGCIGILKDWLLVALDQALEDEENNRMNGATDPDSCGARKPFRYYLDRARDTPGQLMKMLDAACDGEKTWEMMNDHAGLLTKIGFESSDIGLTTVDTPESDSNPGDGASSSSSARTNVQEFKAKDKKVRVPGRRNPHSDSTLPLGA